MVEWSNHDKILMVQSTWSKTFPPLILHGTPPKFGLYGAASQVPQALRPPPPSPPWLAVGRRSEKRLLPSVLRRGAQRRDVDITEMWMSYQAQLYDALYC